MAYKTYGVTSPPTLAEGIPGNVTGTGRSEPFVKFEIFDFLICFGCIFVLFLWQQQDFRNFWGGERGGRGGGEVILKFKPKVFGKYIVILGVVRYDFISTYIALCNL